MTGTGSSGASGASRWSIEMSETVENPVERLHEVFAELGLTAESVDFSVDDPEPPFTRFLSVVLTDGVSARSVAALQEHQDVASVTPEPDATL